MKYRSHHKEIQKNTAQLLDVFDDIYIDRRSPNDVIQKLIKVPCVYSSRSRILKSLENRGNTLTLPLIHIGLSSLSRDPGRAIDVHDGLLKQHGTYDFMKNTPIPVSISYDMGIVTKFQEDADQIMSNFVPFFNPDIYIVVNQPMAVALNLKTQVIWNGSFILEYPNEIDKNTPWRVIASTGFTMKTWLFPGLEGEFPTEGSIETISASFHAVPRTMTFDEYEGNFLSGLVEPEFYDVLTITG